MAALKKKVAKKKSVNKKKVSKKKIIDKRRNRFKPIITKAENGIVDDDIVYVNGTGKPEGGGRPSKSVKLSQIRALASIGCTQQEMAAILGLNRDTFTVLKKNNPIVKEIVMQGKAEGKGSLRRKQHEVAMRGDTQMLKWLGKNRLGQSERILSHTETSQGDSLYKMMKDITESDDE